MSDALIAAATADDVEHFAKKRFPDEQSRKIYADLAALAPNGPFVAKDAGVPVGIAIAHALEDEWFLSELYVEPSLQTQGIGSDLLAEAARDAGDVTRSGLIRAEEFGSLAFYLRRGIGLQVPVLRLAGAMPHDNELARMAAGEYRFTTEPLDPVSHRTVLTQLDREVRGTARPSDHLYFSEHGRGFVFRREEEIAGYAYVWPNGSIGPLVAASHNYAVQLFAFALAALRGGFGASWCTALVPGSNLRIIRASMRAGLRIEGVRLFASDGGLSDLSLYVGFHALLF